MSYARSSGFTLMEILVALAVLGIAMAGLLKAAGSNAENAAYLEQKTLAHWVAMNRIAEFQLADDWPSLGTLSGKAAMASRDWHWSVRVEATDDSDVRRLQVEVRREAGDDAALAALTAYREKRP